MGGHRPPSSDGRPALQSVRRGRRGGWRLAALLVGALAVALIYVGRFGLPELDGPPVSPSASPTAGAAGPPTPTADAGAPSLPPEPGDSFAPTPRTGPDASGGPQPSRPVGPRPRQPADRWPDGIPARIGDERVLRVGPDHVRDGEALLGGWYRDGRLLEAIGTPAAAWLPARGVADRVHGPVVLRGSYTADGRAFEADEVVWTGDVQTDAAPIAVMPLLDALGESFRARDPLRVDPVSLELARVRLDCPVAWPRHTYAATSGPVLLALVFASPIDRLIAESQITHSQYPGADPPPADCPHPVVRGRRLRWIVDGNVMLLIRGGDFHTRLARSALADARDVTDRPEQPWRPLTSWQALRALWSVDPRLDVAPAAEQVFCVLGLPEQSWSIRHQQVRGLAIFDSTAEREKFQASTAATDVRLERGGCSGLGGQRPIDDDARWVGKENVLLLVTGDGQIDAQLERALPSARMRVWWP